MNAWQQNGTTFERHGAGEHIYVWEASDGWRWWIIIGSASFASNFGYADVERCKAEAEKAVEAERRRV